MLADSVLGCKKVNWNRDGVQIGNNFARHLSLYTKGLRILHGENDN